LSSTDVRSRALTLSLALRASLVRSFARGQRVRGGRRGHYDLPARLVIKQSDRLTSPCFISWFWVARVSGCVLQHCLSWWTSFSSTRTPSGSMGRRSSWRSVRDPHSDQRVGCRETSLVRVMGFATVREDQRDAPAETGGGGAFRLVVRVLDCTSLRFLAVAPGLAPDPIVTVTLRAWAAPSGRHLLRLRIHTGFLLVRVGISRFHSKRGRSFQKTAKLRPEFPGSISLPNFVA